MYYWPCHGKIPKFLPKNVNLHIWSKHVTAKGWWGQRPLQYHFKRPFLLQLICNNSPNLALFAASLRLEEVHFQAAPSMVQECWCCYLLTYFCDSSLLVWCQINLGEWWLFLLKFCVLLSISEVKYDCLARILVCSNSPGFPKQDVHGFFQRILFSLFLPCFSQHT